MAPTALAWTKLATLTVLTVLTCASAIAPVWAQTYPVSSTQRQTANDVAQKGVPLSELAANAPERYTVKGGDTLWSISKLFLKSPWRWPELWGMNMADIKNPHRIYPGQVLVLERRDGVATLRLEGAADTEPLTVRVSPRTRYASAADSALPTLNNRFIEPFLAEPLVVGENELKAAPRIVSAQEGRVFLANGDRAYARGSDDFPLTDDGARESRFRVFREATALKDPVTGEVLGYEAQYSGQAVLVRGEGQVEVEGKDGVVVNSLQPATIDIVSSKQEMRVGDRLLPEPSRQLQTYTPRAPTETVLGRIVSIYGSASVLNAGQNQVVALNKGRADGMEPGMVLAILKDGRRMVDRDDSNRPELKLPDERNGLLMVFRSFERVSYALILEITDAVRVGDRLVNPR